MLSDSLKEFETVRNQTLECIQHTENNCFFIRAPKEDENINSEMEKLEV